MIYDFIKLHEKLFYTNLENDSALLLRLWSITVGEFYDKYDECALLKHFETV